MQRREETRGQKRLARRNERRASNRSPALTHPARALVEFHCQRCLCRIDFEVDLSAGKMRPEGWQLVSRGKDLVWRCALCVKDVAGGSPEEL